MLEADPAVRYLLEAMRLFHYMVGITAPERKDEKKILFLWIGVIITLMLIGLGTLFLLPRLLG